MRAKTIGLVLSAVLYAGSAAAYDADDPNNCGGAEWDANLTIAVAKVTAQPRVNFIKSPYDDDFKASSCPADTEACRKKAYLVTGDLVHLGKTQGDFTCVSYQSPLAKKRGETSGWLPSAALTPVGPMQSPKASDWIGTWDHPDGSITIRPGTSGKLRIRGEMLVQGRHDVYPGEIKAEVRPDKESIAFVADGSIPFETPDEGNGECRVRMQRIGVWLMVEDNVQCGDHGVTFTGFYHRKK
jgi:hypothetical protein